MAGKLCWALGLVLLFAAAVLTQAPLAVGLLGFFLLLTLLLVLEVRYLRDKVEAELIVPDQPAVQGRPFVLTVRLTNHSPLPIPQLLTLVQATDEWGGNTITLRCSGMLGSKARAEQRLTLQANKSGVWQLRLQSVTLWDHLGLFKAQCGLPKTAQSLCVLPQSARLGSDTQPDPDADGMQESDRSVLGGNYDVREYREGDSLKQVHWKLSAKLNRLLIREPLAAGTMAGQGSGDGPGEGEGDMWGNFPAEAALHREAPPTKKKAVALSKRGGTDADSGLVFLDRVLISPAVPARDTLWLVVDLCLLLALAFGLVSAAVTAFAVHPPVWVWLALAAWCAGWCLFGRLPRRVQRLGLLAGSLVYLVGLFLCQRSFLAGARQFGAAVAASLNERFNANLAPGRHFAVESAAAAAGGGVPAAGGQQRLHALLAAAGRGLAGGAGRLPRRAPPCPVGGDGVGNLPPQSGTAPGHPKRLGGGHCAGMRCAVGARLCAAACGRFAPAGIAARGPGGGIGGHKRRCDLAAPRQRRATEPACRSCRRRCGRWCLSPGRRLAAARGRGSGPDRQ